MVNVQDIEYRLKQLAGPLPSVNGFHAGLRDNQNAVELEIGMMLMGAILHEKPKQIVELGTGPGYSTTWILLGLEKIQEGHLWTIDVMPSDAPIWRKFELPETRLTYLANDTVESARAQLPPRVDMLFHDAGHDGAQVVSDLELLAPRIPVGGTIAIHDVQYSRAMGDAVVRWFEERGEEWRYEEINMGCGIGIARRLSGGYVERTDAQEKLEGNQGAAGAAAVGGAGPGQALPERPQRLGSGRKVKARGVRRKTASKRAKRPRTDKGGVDPVARGNASPRSDLGGGIKHAAHPAVARITCPGCRGLMVKGEAEMCTQCKERVVGN